MQFFEIPKLQDVLLQREFPNICTDQISSNPSKNNWILPLYRFLEENYLGINTEMTVKEHSFKSHVHVPPYENNDAGYFRVYNSGSDKIIFVVPQRGGLYGYTSARLAASSLASRGFTVYEIVTPLREKRLPDGVTTVMDLPTDAQTIKMVTKQAVEEILGLADLVAKGESGIVGISQGAAYASMASIDSRITSSAYIHGFGDFASLLVNSQDRFAKHFRRQAMKRGESIDEKLLREELMVVDPLTYVTSENPDRVLMVNSRNDKSLPESNILALYEALGKPNNMHWFNIPFLNPHVYILLHTKRILKLLAEHFERTLK